MQTITKIAEMMDWAETQRRAGKTIGFVPTMGALHRGHVSLIRRSKNENDRTVVSIFVNPLQFGPGEDYEKYPRRLKDDSMICEEEGVDVVFSPQVGEMYPPGFCTSIDQKRLPEVLCGKFRPGHFRGVMTVIVKLFNAVKPHRAYFGQKDYQQYVIVKHLVDDLNFGIQIIMCETVREPDGLAMSSRNEYLSPRFRRKASIISKALMRARESIRNGNYDCFGLISQIKRDLRTVRGIKIDYVSIVNPDTLEDMAEIKGQMLIAVAVRLGGVRLIDNILVSRKG